MGEEGGFGESHLSERDREIEVLGGNGVGRRWKERKWRERKRKMTSAN